MSDQDCKHAPRIFTPIVDFSRCEGKGPCLEVCPYNVFEIRKIEPSDYAALGLLSRELRIGCTAVGLHTGQMRTNAERVVHALRHARSTP